MESGLAEAWGSFHGSQRHAILDQALQKEAESKKQLASLRAEAEVENPRIRHSRHLVAQLLGSFESRQMQALAQRKRLLDDTCPFPREQYCSDCSNCRLHSLSNHRKEEHWL